MSARVLAIEEVLAVWENLHKRTRAIVEANAPLLAQKLDALIAEEVRTGTREAQGRSGDGD